LYPFLEYNNRYRFDQHLLPFYEPFDEHPYTHIMATTNKHILIAGLGSFVPKDYEMGDKLGIQKSNKQMVLDVNLPFL
jgi:hypothetical protein